MTLIALIRHGRTSWNEERRIQGHTDIPLSDRGRAEMAPLAPPEAFLSARWYVSPLTRARETADLLGIVDPQIEPRLLELAMGDWEGKTRDQVRVEDPEGWAARESGALDARTHGGETRRDLLTRLLAWFDDQAALGGMAGAICHRGVISNLMSTAYGWDFTGEPPVTLSWTAAHVFRALGGGRLEPVEMNVPLPQKT